MKKSVLVVGGAGFIGSNLSRYLSHKYNVLVYDNFSTSKYDNIKDISCELTNLEEGIKRCDYIFHLAASVGVQYVNNNPKGAMINNLDMERRVFELNDKYNRVPLFFASTSEVYGNSPDVPYKESQPLHIGEPTQGRWGYSCSKLMGEFLAMYSDFPVVVGRFFNVTGKNQLPDYGMVLPNFIRKGLMGEPITVYGDGKAVRCFCCVEEVVVAMDRLISDDSCYGQVFNIGNPKNQIDMESLAIMVRDITGGRSDIIYKPFNEVFKKNPTDIQFRVPDISKIERYIGWKPVVTNNEIINKMTHYVHSNLNK